MVYFVIVNYHDLLNLKIINNWKKESRGIQNSSIDENSIAKHV